MDNLYLMVFYFQDDGLTEVGQAGLLVLAG
jgi:hypothetical protein